MAKGMFGKVERKAKDMAREEEDVEREERVGL